ncbi:hypothetical protein HZS_4796 [Henneguya salminicola]|nr:hypothetical protein HZS_4796 [Henneguya salminicola]
MKKLVFLQNLYYLDVQSTFLNKPDENYFELTEPIPIQFNTPQTSFKPQASPLLYNEREEKNNVSANTISEASVDEIDATYEPPLDMIAVKNFESTETPFAFKTKDKLLVMFKSQNFYYAEIGEHGDWFPCNSVTLYSNLNDATIFENQYTVNGFRVGLYNNEIEEHDDIPFAKDDILIELEDLGEWIRGYSNGKIGLYPKNYTETLTCLNVIEVATATQDYTSTNDCELTISRGKKIAVLNKNSTGWSVVVEENSADIGFIPTQCIV